MTVSELRLLLAQVPADLDSCPVMIRVGDQEEPACVLTLFEPCEGWKLPGMLYVADRSTSGEHGPAILETVTITDIIAR